MSPWLRVGSGCIGVGTRGLAAVLADTVRLIGLCVIAAFALLRAELFLTARLTSGETLANVPIRCSGIKAIQTELCISRRGLRSPMPNAFSSHPSSSKSDQTQASNPLTSSTWNNSKPARSDFQTPGEPLPSQTNASMPLRRTATKPELRSRIMRRERSAAFRPLQRPSGLRFTNAQNQARGEAA